jgi:hypothetical protein
MSLITLHDHLNPDQEVYLESKSITGISPFGSGSSVQCDGTLYGIHETPSEVDQLCKENQ